MQILQWKRNADMNSTAQIQHIKSQMEFMQEQGGQRDWHYWRELRASLGKAYEEEELFWKQKARV